MKIIIDNAGQTCNKFWCYIPPLIDCIKNNKKCIILYYDVQLESFPKLLKNKYFKYPTYSRLFNKLLGIESYNCQIRKCFKNKRYDIYPFIFKFLGSFFEYSWDRRYEKIPQECFIEIKKIFRPKEEIIKDIELNFQPYKTTDIIIVGVHIRRGDYENFLDGNYYYSIKEYVNICKIVQSYFNGKNIVFFIASNEKIDPNDMKDIKYFAIKHSSVVKDLYGLTYCDYIVGPPSSFSRWASFYGQVPIYFIMKPRIKECDLQFRRMACYGYYEDNVKVDFDF